MTGDTVRDDDRLCLRPAATDAVPFAVPPAWDLDDVPAVLEAMRATTPDVRWPSLFPEDPRRLIDSPHDQEHVTDNPYWELVRHYPLVGQSRPPQPEEAVQVAGMLGPRDLHTRPDRHDLIRWFARSVPTPADLTWLRDRLAGRGLLEVGAGTGYWAWQLAQLGVDVLAVDRVPPDANPDVDRPRPFHPLTLEDAATAAARHPQRVLMLAWPPMEEPMDLEALTAYRGDTVITVGELSPATGTDAGRDHLREHWTPYDRAPRHVVFGGMFDRLLIWARVCHLPD